MSIFGQVWLWSAAAFVVGVLLTWLFLARPAQARSRHLERRLLAAQNAPAAQPARTFDRDPVSAPVAKKKPITAEPGPEQAEEHHAPPSWLERDSLAGRSPSYQSGSEIDDDSLFTPEPEPEPAAEATTIFKAFDREPATSFDRDDAAEERGSLFVREPSEAGTYDREEPGSIFEREEPRAGRGSLFEQAESGSSFEREQAAESGRGSLFETEDQGRGSSFEREQAAGHGSLFNRDEAPEPERGSLFDPEHAPEPPRAAEPASAFTPFAAPEPEPPAYAFGGDEQQLPAEEEGAAETTQVLPKRQPRQSRHAFDPPKPVQPVQPSMRTVERREPTQPEGERSGSLFEPTPRAAHAPTPPPVRSHGDSIVPPGPFGPGSAMPRPGGGQPSEEFVVKASVTALRYCTEDSAQFGRMVAEVWFRSAEDAERVGFRPL